MNDGNSRQIASSIIDHQLSRIQRATERCPMCELSHVRELDLREAIAELDAKLIAVIFESKQKDRSRRLTIGNLYMALIFLAGFASYLAVRHG